MPPRRGDDRLAHCPERRDRGLVLAEPETRPSRRTLPIAPQPVGALRHHSRAPRKARIYTESAWSEGRLVSTAISGRPTDPRDHSLHWTEFLERAGVRPARFRDARHTAVTLLLVQGVDQRVVMDMLGWTSPTMTARYQHVVPELVEEANRRMSELLWGKGADDRLRG